MKTIFKFLFLLVLPFMMLGSIQAQEDDPCEIGYALSTVSTKPLCYGDDSGSASVASTGCDCMFSGCTYLWKTIEGDIIEDQIFHTAYDLAAGEYTVVVNHPDGCIMEVNIVVDEAEEFVEEYIVEPIVCKDANNGSITVVPSEGNEEELTYLWNTGAQTASVEDLTPGSYQVIITDFGNCSITKVFTITEESETPLTCVFETVESCESLNNGIIYLIAQGGVAPYEYAMGAENYQSESVFSDLAAGMYEVYMRDVLGCETSMEIEIPAVPLPELDILAGSNNICKGELTSLQVYTGIPNLSYSWSPVEGISNPGSNVVIASPEETTTYTVTITNEAGCEKNATITVEVQECAEQVNAVPSIALEKGLSFYPNPINDILNIETPKTASIKLFGLNGKTLRVIEVQSGQTQLDLEDLNKGVYFLLIESEDGLFHYKLVKE